jgi:hypothetical protein
MALFTLNAVFLPKNLKKTAHNGTTFRNNAYICIVS